MADTGFGTRPKVPAVGTLYVQDCAGCMAHAIGRAGLEDAELGQYLTATERRMAALKREIAENAFPHARILADTADIAEAHAALDRLCEGARLLVLFGTGGSSLGGQALAQLGGWFIPGDDTAAKAGRPRLRFYDNLDATSLAQGIAGLDLETTRFLVISKSGNTAETLIQVLTVIDRLKAEGHEHRIGQLFLGITEARDGVPNGLRTLLAGYGVPLLPHDTGIGGRFSVFTNVGILAGLARGLDMTAFRTGALAVVQALLTAETPQDFAPAVGAAIAIGLARERGVRSSVMMPYADRLERFSRWYVQLWSESLGKSGQGTTPVAALGPVDQHSQLQLFLDGPNHHLVTLVRGAHAMAGGPTITPDMAAMAGAPYLGGHTVGELVHAQAQAIGQVFINQGRPVRVFEFERLDEATLGALMMHFIFETILAAEILGVDPFDQPAVELGKQLTRETLARIASVREHAPHGHQAATAIAD